MTPKSDLSWRAWWPMILAATTLIASAAVAQYRIELHEERLSRIEREYQPREPMAIELREVSRRLAEVERELRELRLAMRPQGPASQP